MSNNLSKKKLIENGRKGGKRGRGKAHHTLKAELARAHIIERVTRRLDPLLDAQFMLAQGSYALYRKDFVNGNKKHIHITDPKEVTKYFDTLADTEEGKKYFLVNLVKPDNDAIKDMINRAYGRPTETLEHKGGPVNVIFDGLGKLGKE